MAMVFGQGARTEHASRSLREDLNTRSADSNQVQKIGSEVWRITYVRSGSGGDLGVSWSDFKASRRGTG